VEESRLAEVLGDRQLFLRVGFTPSGQLVWSLFERDGDRLSTRGHGGSRDGVNARELVLSAVRRHDEAVSEIWARLRLAQKWDHLKFLIKLPTPLIDKADWPAVRPLGDEAPRSARRKPPSITFGTDFSAASPGSRPKEPTPTSGGPSGQSGMRNDSTPGLSIANWTGRRLCCSKALRPAWPLDELYAALEGAEKKDLIIQTEDVLHGVPVAFLRNGGQFLFERVESARSVLSLSLLDWLGDLDRRAFRDTLDVPDKILSLSWFKGDDHAARRGAERLHEGHRRLSRQSPRAGIDRSPEWYSAADKPKGTHGCLARGLATHDVFRVVSVCGHGMSQLSGIELGDGIWNGSSLLEAADNGWIRRDACDLLGIEFMIQISCSIGRVQQTEEQDVEGFAVELAVNRARSVLAGLWPLHSENSPAFANEVVGHYLRLRAEAVRDAGAEFEGFCREDSSLRGNTRALTSWISHRLSDSCPRARAVAAARREWLAGIREGADLPGLNTAAAFELFGLG